MREDAHDLGVGKLVDLFDIGNGCGNVVSLVADPAHSGICNKDDFADLALTVCFFVESLYVLGIADGRDDVIFNNCVSIHVGNQTQHDDVFLVSGLSQYDGFLKSGDGKGLAALLLEDLSIFDGAVTVSVGLDNADKL